MDVRSPGSAGAAFLPEGPALDESLGDNLECVGFSTSTSFGPRSDCTRDRDLETLCESKSGLGYFGVRDVPHGLRVRGQLFDLPECVVQLFLVVPGLFFE